MRVILTHLVCVCMLRYLPEGIKAAAALGKARSSGGAGTGGVVAVVEAVLTAAEETLLLQPTSLRPLYHQVLSLAAEHLGDASSPSLRELSARVLALTPRCVCVCVCVCARARVRVRVRGCVCVCDCSSANH